MTDIGEDMDDAEPLVADGSKPDLEIRLEDHENKGNGAIM
jgi:hypothetical protein